MYKSLLQKMKSSIKKIGVCSSLQATLILLFFAITVSCKQAADNSISSISAEIDCNSIGSINKSIIIENDRLKVKINTEGAQLQSIFIKHKNDEILWIGDPD